MAKVADDERKAGSTDDGKPLENDDDKPGGDAGGDLPDKDAEIAKWKSLSRKHEGQAKANAQAAAKLKELEDASKSESQKLAEEKAAAESVAKSASGELMRLRVAMRKGLTEVQAKRLVGDTEDELEADADELLESFGGKKDAGSDTDNGRPTRPKERLRPGAAPDEEPEETDPRKLAATVSRL